MKAFQESLVHDLDAERFADMYAQTISYGLLSSRIADPSKKTADDFAAHMRTSPFLRELMQTFLKAGGRKGNSDGAGIDFDELGVADVVELLDGANMEAVLRDFGDRNRQEDPVIHFFEGFLQAYDRRIRKDRGVFYTPQPVVSYIVRSVHELIKAEFGLEDGLASTITWGEMLKKHPTLKLPQLTDEPDETRKISPDEPFVQILDPATGTATFLVEVIDVIHRTLLVKWKQQHLTEVQQLDAWNNYVPKHLLPRLHAFELMMAPYAIAHMKIGLKLAETGYRFGTEERARIYLTNALEPWMKQLRLIGLDALAREASAVNEVKRHKRFTVIVGNPPYSGISWNMTEAAQQLVDRYRHVNGEPLGERKLWLQNDYVKFLGFAHKLILNTGVGCIGYITDNSYVDGPTFRGVRSNLLQDFSTLQVINLNGSAKKVNMAAVAETDQNVFDIAQAVAVIHGVRWSSKSQCNFRTASLLGSRQSKYEKLSKQNIDDISWSNFSPSPPFFQFVEINRSGDSEYKEFYSIKEAFPIQSVGIQTSRDHLAIALTRQELLTKILEFASANSSDHAIRERFFPGKKVGDYLAGDTRGWSLSVARKELQKVRNLESQIVGINYRPFDFRFIFNSTLLVDWPRPEVSEQMASGKNLGLCVLRRTENARDYDYFSVSRDTISNHQVSLKDGTYLLPLWLESDKGRQGLFSVKSEKTPNLSPKFLSAVATALQLPQKGEHGLPAGLSPEDIFHYAYAVFHSPSYRSRYAEFLKMDFPRLPLTRNLGAFRALAEFGAELTALHLFESSQLDRPITEFIGTRNIEVEKISRSRDTVWVDKAQTTGFRGVREPVWNFHIGGYQVCEKWLKDRKGRTLSKEDIAHYQKIVVALSETIRLMQEIDAVIDQYGGWLGAFQSTNE
jgi:predicted helicase